MQKRYKSEHGVITVFVSLILTGVLSLGTLTIESGRIQAAKTQLEDANISASTSMIASYDADLYERYKLLAIDKKVFTEERYRDYLDFNSDLAPGFLGNNVSRMYSVEDVEIDGVYNLTYPSVMKRQILTFAKYNIDQQDYSLNTYMADTFFDDLQNKAEYVSDRVTKTSNKNVPTGNAVDVSATMMLSLVKMQDSIKALKKSDDTLKVTLDGASVALLPSTTGVVESSIPSEDMTLVNASVSKAEGLLGSSGSYLASASSEYEETNVSLNVSSVSKRLSAIDVKDLGFLIDNSDEIAYECELLAEGLNAAIRALRKDQDGNLLLNSYIAGFFSNRTTKASGHLGPAAGTGSIKNANFSSACTEYIFGGKSSEVANQQVAYDYIFATRLINNIYTTFTSSNTFNENRGISVACHIIWAYYETCVDMELLTKYNAVVPMTKYNLILPVNDPTKAASALMSGNFESAMNALGVRNGSTYLVPGVDQTTYKDALAQALWFVPNTQKMLRVADLIQLEMRYKEQYVDKQSVTFLMSEQNTYCRAKCVVKMNSVLPVLSVGSGEGVNNYQFKSVKYVGF